MILASLCFCLTLYNTDHSFARDYTIANLYCKPNVNWHPCLLTMIILLRTIPLTRASYWSLFCSFLNTLSCWLGSHGKMFKCMAPHFIVSARLMHFSAIRVWPQSLPVLAGQSSWRGNGNRISWAWLSAEMGTEWYTNNAKGNSAL